MKYILINDIQKNSKEIDMPQNDIVFLVSMSWVIKNQKFDIYWFFNICGHTIGDF
jgi:hypothetical protein